MVIAATIAPSVAIGQERDTTRTDTTRVTRISGVVVTGTRLTDAADERTPGQVDVLQVRGLMPGPARATDALLRLPGITAFDDQGSRLQPTFDVRGFTLSPVVGVPQGVSVFLDGVRINEPDAQQVHFHLIPFEVVERAELVRGPASLFGKNTLGGALLLFTERGKHRTAIDADLEAGAFGYVGGRVAASGARAGFDFLGMVRTSNEDGYRDQSAARSRMLFGTIGRRGEERDLALSILFSRDSLEQPGSLPESWIGVHRRANYTGGDFFRPELLHVAVRGSARLFGGELRGNAYNRANDAEQYNVNVEDPHTRAFIRTNTTGGTAELAQAIPLGVRTLAFTVGVELSRSDVRYRIFQEPHGDAPHLPADCDLDTGVCERVRVVEANAAAFAQGTLPLTDALSVTAAARADYVRVPFRDLRDSENDGTSTFRRISPRFGANLALGARARAFVAIGTGFRAPAALELACADEDAPCPLPFSLGDDPPLDAVRVTSYEAGLEVDPLPSVALEITTFRTDVRDEIVFVASQSAAGYFRNIPRTRRQGVEARGEAALPAGLRARASYGFVDATYRSRVQLASAIEDAAPAEPGDRIPLSPSHRGLVAVGVTRAIGAIGLDAELSTRAISRQFLRGDDANDHPPLRGYAVTSFRARAESRHVVRSLFVSNLFDHRHETFGIYGENPRGPLAAPGVVIPIGDGEEPVERFLTPGYPRALSVAATLRRSPAAR